MKHLSAIFTFTFFLHLSSLYASAAVPLKWTVETSRAQPATLEAYQGETLDFEAALQSYGKPLELPVTGASSPRLFWQTNGMGSAYWSAPCTVPVASSPRGADTNLLCATWLPSYDVGARAYNCFIGLTGTIYHAAFQLRLRPSPGAVPNELPLPQKVIDFAQVTVLNPPWSGGGSGGIDTNAVIDITTPLIASATNAVPRIVMGEQEVRADLTAKVPSGWADQWEPAETEKPNPPHDGETYYEEVHYVEGIGWCAVEQIYMGVWATSIIDYPMLGDYTNPDATELTFPDGTTVTHRVPATAETRLATTNDLNDLNTTLTNAISLKLDKTGGVVNGDLVANGTLGWDGFTSNPDYPTEFFCGHYYYFNTGTEMVELPRTSGRFALVEEIPDISTNNPAFVAAVQSIAPSSPPSLRLYDEVRGCWWIGRMVNGVISWEVEE